MPAVESISVLVECANLGLELFKIVRAGFAQAFSKDAFKTLSSLTTLEFVYSNGQQVAHYVQDRQIVFTKEGYPPPFLYATEGVDEIDELMIDNMPERFVVEEKRLDHPASIRQHEPTQYSKNHRISMALLARSTNGFTQPREKFSMKVVRWVGKSQVAIVFPNDKKPVSWGTFYRVHNDPPELKRHAGRQACLLRKTTCQKWILLWEVTNATPERTYTLEWTWPT
jgi:hypothetical protein